MWSMSATAFLALILVVHFNLCTRLYYITWVHIIMIPILEVGAFIGYMWISNVLPPEVSRQQYAISEIHRSPEFYLNVTCCIAFTFLLDLAIYCWVVLIR